MNDILSHFKLFRQNFNFILLFCIEFRKPIQLLMNSMLQCLLLNSSGPHINGGSLQIAITFGQLLALISNNLKFLINTSPNILKNLPISNPILLIKILILFHKLFLLNMKLITFHLALKFTN